MPPLEHPHATTVVAALEDGPLKGSTVEAEIVEGRPRKTIDVPAGERVHHRYCLADWVQTGRCAVYTFLYHV